MPFVIVTINLEGLYALLYTFPLLPQSTSAKTECCTSLREFLRDEIVHMSNSTSILYVTKRACRHHWSVWGFWGRGKWIWKNILKVYLYPCMVKTSNNLAALKYYQKQFVPSLWLGWKRPVMAIIVNFFSGFPLRTDLYCNDHWDIEHVGKPIEGSIVWTNQETFLYRDIVFCGGLFGQTFILPRACRGHTKKVIIFYQSGVAY